MSYQTLKFELDGALARITLNRPDAANSMNMDMMRELFAAAIECDSNAEIRAVLLTGEGKMFSAGGDLGWFGQHLDNIGPLLTESAAYLHNAISHFSRMKKPLVIAVNGPAAGAGMSLAVVGDYTLASESASFTMAYTAAGLSPDGGASYFIPRLIGERRAKELMLTNRKLSAAEAKDWGLINDVVPADKLLATAEKMAQRLAQGPTQAFAKVKELLISSAKESLEAQMELEARGIAGNATGTDGQEGITAFLEKRRPTYTGK